MSEKFLPHQETGRATKLRASCDVLLRQAITPRELIVTIKNWVLMREDLRQGKYIQMVDKMDGARPGPNPYEALKIVDEIRNEIPIDEVRLDKLKRGLEGALRMAEDAQRQLNDALTDFIELAWQKFFTSNPSPDEIALFKEQVPQLADRADSLKKD